jgi:regulation of enolase protein 1 (concanavalin A-like superfamily)
MIPVDARHTVSRMTNRDRSAWAANNRMEPTPLPSVRSSRRGPAADLNTSRRNSNWTGKPNAPRCHPLLRRLPFVMLSVLAIGRRRVKVRRRHCEHPRDSRRAWAS